MIEFGKNEDNLRMMPMDLDSLLQTVWIWISPIIYGDTYKFCCIKEI